MNAKQEAEKWLASDSIDACECGLHLNNILELLKATERKLAKAEKVVEAANLTIEILKSTGAYTKDKVFNVMTRLEKTLSDYEASKGVGDES